MGEVVRAAPDGYTLLVGGFGGQIVPPLMNDDFPFDVRRDIVKIAMTAEFANVAGRQQGAAGRNRSPELIAYLKARPGQLNFGSSGRATSDRLAAEMFMLETGTKMLNVPYRGGGVALNDMMAGTTQVMFPQLPAVLGMVKRGGARAGGDEQLPAVQLPDVPTLDETSLPGFHVASWNMLFAPRGLPETIRKTAERRVGRGVRQGPAVPRAHVEDRGRAGRQALGRGRGVLRGGTGALEKGHRPRRHQAGRFGSTSFPTSRS